MNSASSARLGQPVADQIPHPRVGDMVLRCHHQHLEHRHQVIRRTPALGAMANRHFPLWTIAFVCDNLRPAGGPSQMIDRPFLQIQYRTQLDATGIAVLLFSVAVHVAVFALAWALSATMRSAAGDEGQWTPVMIIAGADTTLSRSADPPEDPAVPREEDQAQEDGAPAATAQAAPTDPPPLPAPVAPSAPSSPMAASSGSGDDDPYAGAAVPSGGSNLNGLATAPLAAGLSVPLKVNDRMWQAVVRQLVQEGGGGAHSLSLLLDISLEGDVIDCRAIGGDASAEVEHRACLRMQGLHLFEPRGAGADAQWVALPEIHF